MHSPLPGMTFSAQSTSCSPCCLPSSVASSTKTFPFPTLSLPLSLEALGLCLYAACSPALPPAAICCPNIPSYGVLPDYAGSLLPPFLRVFAPAVPLYRSAPGPTPSLTIPHSAQCHLFQELSPDLPTLNSTIGGSSSVLPIVHRGYFCHEQMVSASSGVHLREPQRRVPREERRLWEACPSLVGLSVSFLRPDNSL